jgi:hypothetical protein
MSADAEESLRARILCGSHINFGKVAESIAWPTKSSWIRSQLKAIGFPTLRQLPVARQAGNITRRGVRPHIEVPYNGIAVAWPPHPSQRREVTDNQTFRPGGDRVFIESFPYAKISTIIALIPVFRRVPK